MREARASCCEYQLAHQSPPTSAQFLDRRGASQNRSTRRDAMRKRLVYICDWLPPDFGAVGQYAVLFAHEWAREGWDVTLVGLTSGQARRQPAEPIEAGSLQVRRVHRPAYKKQR